MSLEFARTLDSIPVYPAASTYAFTGDLVKLASNETPYPPHPQVLEAVAHAAKNLNRYPDPSGTKLRQAIADRTGVQTSHVTLGNGSCEILLAAAQAMLEPGAEIVYAWPSFSMYPQLAAMTGARAIEVPLTADQKHDLEAMGREVTAATRILLICNPNNPTATAHTAEELDAFIASIPRHVAVIVDEAYVEFQTLQDPDTTLELLDKHPNVVLLRTFSKVYGLCGLRVGYGLGPVAFKSACDRVRQPFSVNLLAQAAATEALKHQDEVAKRVELTAVERIHIESELEDRGLTLTDSQANFAWVSFGEKSEADVMKGLGERGVIIRSGTDLGGPGWARVTYGTRRENDAFLAALDEALAAAGPAD
jgi:histidinol-phosphate aminotransferase